MGYHPPRCKSRHRARLSLHRRWRSDRHGPARRALGVGGRRAQRPSGNPARLGKKSERGWTGSRPLKSSTSSSVMQLTHTALAMRCSCCADPHAATTQTNGVSTQTAEPATQSNSTSAAPDGDRGRRVCRTSEVGIRRVFVRARRRHVEVSPWLPRDLRRQRHRRCTFRPCGPTEATANSIENSDEDGDVKNEGLAHLGESTYSDLAEIAHLIKEPGFAGENEVRIVITFLWRGKHIRYRSGAYGVVGYVELG